MEAAEPATLTVVLISLSSHIRLEISPQCFHNLLQFTELLMIQLGLLRQYWRRNNSVTLSHDNAYLHSFPVGNTMMTAVIKILHTLNTESSLFVLLGVGGVGGEGGVERDLARLA